LNCSVPLIDPLAGTVRICELGEQTGSTSSNGPGFGPAQTTLTCPVKPFNEVSMNWLVPAPRSEMLTLPAVRVTVGVAAHAAHTGSPQQKINNMQCKVE
jgi:hypothetical protein